MLEKQQLVLDHDAKGTVHLYNTYNYAEELALAKELAKAGGMPIKLGNGVEIRSMGNIPQDLWLIDPILKEANRARKAGDMGEYTRLLNKFFEEAPLLKAPFYKKYY